MRLRTVLLALAATGAVVYAAIPVVTGRTWDRIIADGERAVRDVTTSSVRAPQAQAPVKSGPSAAPPPQLTVSLPVERGIVDWDEATGRFEAPEVVDLRSRVSGYLQEVRFKDGQDVKQGDVLFVIDPRPAERALAQAEAELELARTRIANAELDVERARPLVERRIVSEKTYDDRANLKREAEAQAKVAEARVATAVLDLSFTRITAPVSGRIGRTTVTAGNFVAQSGGNASSTSLATIVMQDPIYVYFDITEADWLKYKRLAEQERSRDGRSLAAALEGARVEVKLADETGWSHAGRLDFLDNRLDSGTASLRVRAVLANPYGLFTPGQFARVRIRASRPYTALLVPDTAIGTDQANRFVMVVGPGDTAVRKQVALGPLVDGLRVIQDGVSKDDWVVTRGLSRIRPGQRMVPQREALKVSVGETPPVPLTR